jgi:hypothetical protein
MEACVVGPGDPRWADVLRRAEPDFYHHPAYTTVCAAHEHAEPAALIVEGHGGAMLVPLLLRPIAGGMHDATSPPGYPGALVVGGRDDAWLGRALHAGVDRLRSLGMVSLYVRLHPLLNAGSHAGIGTLVRHPDTVTVDLGLSEEELWRETRPRFRSQIGHAERAGHDVLVASDDASLGRFVDLYRATMARVDAAPAYAYEDAYFTGLRDAFHDAFHIALVDIGGEPAAGGLFIEGAGILHLHLAGSDPRFSREHASKLMVHRMRGWARARGLRWMHLGGGRGTEDDTLLRFKTGFSKVRTPYRTLRVVVDDERYRSLVERRFPSGVPPRSAGFFPAYRAP